MSEHSPAPWGADRRNGFHAITDAESDPVAVVHDVYAGDGGFSNARLIAAAPDLLEALKAMVDCQIETWPAGVFAQARAALAKAEGK